MLTILNEPNKFIRVQFLGKYFTVRNIRISVVLIFNVQYAVIMYVIILLDNGFWYLFLNKKINVKH